MTLKNKHLLYTEIAKLIEAGFGMRESAQTIIDTGVDAEQTRLLRFVKDALEDGKSIAAAFSEGPSDLTEMEQAIIEAGERSGRLGPAFTQLGDYFELLASSREEMIKSLIYPAVLLHVGVFLSSISMKIGESPDGFGSIIGRFFVTLIIAYLVLVVIYFGFRRLFQMAPKNAAVDHWLSRIPFLGKARKNLALARFAKVYHGSLVSGLSMHQTVKMSAAASNSGMIYDAGENLTKVVDEGQPLGPVFQKEEVFPDAFSRSYLTAEKAGSLDKDLERWGTVFAEDARSSAKRVAV